MVVISIPILYNNYIILRMVIYNMKKAVAILCAISIILSLNINIFATEDTGTASSGQNQQNIVYDVMIVSGGANKTQVINEIRTMTGLSLQPARQIVDIAPLLFAVGLSKDDAEQLKSRFEALGATMELRPVPAQDSSQPAPQQDPAYDVVLLETDGISLALLQEIYSYTGFGILETSRLVQKLPQTIKSRVSKEYAEQIKGRLELFNATAEARLSSSVASSQQAPKQKHLYDVLVKTVAKGSITQVEALPIRDALIAKGLDAKIEITSGSPLNKKDPFEDLLRNRLTVENTTPALNVTLYDVVIMTMIEKGSDEAKALQTKGTLESLGVKVELREQVQAPITQSPDVEKSTYDVVLITAGEKKIQIMRILKEQLGIGLKEAKDLADNAPCVVKKGATKEEAEKLKSLLEEQGGTVELR